MIALPVGAAITNAFDVNGRMTATVLNSSGGITLDASIYTYDLGNQRTLVERIGSLTNNAQFTNAAATYTTPSER